jgi:hypothetical protein
LLYATIGRILRQAEFIATLDGDLAPLRGVATLLAGTPSTIYMPLSESAIARYEKLHAFSILPRYRQILKRINGARLFKMNLFGIPASMAEDPPLLSRSAPAPLDLATANQHWKFEYDVSHDWFHFGAGPFSHSENVGYFFDSNNTIVAARNAGQFEGRWNEFQLFLREELYRCESVARAAAERSS